MMLLSWLIKASVVVVVAALVQAALARRMSAAMRHLVWALTMVGLLLIPALSFTLPAWQVVPAETQRRPVGDQTCVEGLRRGQTVPRRSLRPFRYSGPPGGWALRGMAIGCKPADPSHAST
jgi:hypothetical protein